MFITKRMPVTVFSSDDAGAPVLENTSGSLKNLLNACLVTGYGGKQALGWEILFEESASAVFRSKAADSNRYHLQVKNNNAKYAEMAVYSAMSSLDVGELAMRYNNNYHRFAYIGYNGEIPNWRLVGHGKAFVLCLTPAGQRSSGVLFFGDFPSLAAADTGNTLFLHSLQNNEYLTQSNITENFGALPKRFNGTAQRASTRLNSLCYQFSGVPYPDPANQGLTASEIYIEEELQSGSKWVTRGLLPGLYKVKQDLSAFNEGAVFDDISGSSDRWLKFDFSGSTTGSSDHNYLLNATSWEA